jgi:uncharacterized membrane protein
MAPLHTEKTSTGLDANLAASLSYLVGFVTGILFLIVEKENKFVRFHAMQSTLVFVGLLFVQLLLKVTPFIGGLLFVVVLLPFSAVLWLALLYKAYQGEEFKLPLVGQMAADRT